VGGEAKADRLLQAHSLCNRRVLDRGESRRIDLAVAELPEGLAQFRRAQQAADVLGAEWRVLALAHVLLRSSRTRLALNSVFGRVPGASTSTATCTAQRVRTSDATRRATSCGVSWLACSRRTVITSSPSGLVASTISNSSPEPATARTASSN